MLTQIVNGKILTPSGWLSGGSLILKGNKILEVATNDLALRDAELVDAKGMYVVPGGVEMHIHGGGGRDFQEGTADAFRTAIAAHAQHGMTSIYPTLSSSTVPMIEQALDTCEKLMDEPDSPILGLHLEGPYFNHKRAGAQIPEWIKNPDPAEYIPLLERSKCLKRWDAAPELPGTAEFARECVKHGVLASIAHTAADYADVLAGWKAGFSHATHFYNAMGGFHNVREYKHEGTVESIYLIDDMTVECVADGIHVPPTILRMAYKFKGVERMAVITDALACAVSDNAAAFDPRVIIEDGVCKLAESFALAGSIATTDRLIRTMALKAEVPLADAVRMASETPARIMGVDDRKGTLQKGKDADILILDHDLNIRKIWQMGKVIKDEMKSK